MALRVAEAQPLDRARAHLVQTTDDAFELLRWLSTRDEIALDTETTGLDRDTDRARLVQVGDAMDGWAIPFERNAMLVDDVAARFRGTYYMHNATFDRAMLAGGGVELPTGRIADTRLMAHVLHSTGSLALKNLCQRYVDPRAAAAQEALDEAIGRHGGWTWATVPVSLREYWAYGALDPVLTFRLKEVLEPMVEAEAPESYRLEMAVSWVTERMARLGAHVDRPYAERFAAELSAYVASVEEWCLDGYGISSPGSTEPVVRQLERDGVVLTKRTRGGAVSIDKEVLGALRHPLAAAVLGRRQAQKLVSTYLSAYLAGSERDGRIHPSINSVGGTAKNPFESGGSGRGVRTGRMSSDSPNMQNVPIRTKEGKRIRNSFDAMCSARCGCGEPHKWVKCDFDQIEMRLFAHISRDARMIEAFRETARGGVDMFLGATREIFADPAIEKSDVRRQHTKNAFYAKLFGAGVEQFARTAGIRNADGSLDALTAGAFLVRLDQLYPGIRALQQAIEAYARQRRDAEGEAYVRSPLTRRKHVADEGRDYSLTSYMIQGTAGEILKLKMIEADRAGLGEFMTLPVHDEVDLDVPADRLGDVVATLRDVMNDADMLDVPITSTISVGDRWGDVEDV